jgi:hypothetical protein
MKRERYTLWPAALGLAIALSIAACGDDDDNNGGSQGGADTSEQQFCDAGERLETQVSELASLNVAQAGTNELQRRLDEMQGTVADLRESGREVAASEIDTLEEAVDRLESDFDAVRVGEVTSEEATALVNDAIAAGEAAEAVFTKWRETCQ